MHHIISVFLPSPQNISNLVIYSPNFVSVVGNGQWLRSGMIRGPPVMLGSLLRRTLHKLGIGNAGHSLWVWVWASGRVLPTLFTSWPSSKLWSLRHAAARAGDPQEALSALRLLPAPRNSSFLRGTLPIIFGPHSKKSAFFVDGAMCA